MLTLLFLIVSCIGMMTSMVTATAPIVAFSGSPKNGLAPLNVTFTDSSAGMPTGWAWFFGDENYTAPWTWVNASVGWSARSSHTSVVMTNGSILVMGGAESGSYKNDVWRSVDDGVTWTCVNASAGWTPRFRHSSVALPDGSVVLMGGYAGGIFKNDVWRSVDDGATWMCINASAGWTGRYAHSSVVMLDSSIILMGGIDSNWNEKNDVWRSTDSGVTWTRVTVSAGWSARSYHTTVVLPDGSIVLMGGSDSVGPKNDVWRSLDNGATWTRMTLTAGWSARDDHSSVVMPDGSVVLTGGYDSIGPKNDVWRSLNNGTTWTLMNASAGWSERNAHTSMAIRDGSIMLMGGMDSDGRKNDAWRFQPSGSSIQDPSHTYMQVGTYPVILQAYNADGYNSTRKIGYISVLTPPLTPSISSISPSSAIAGAPTFNLTISGTNFTAISACQWNEVNLTTWYVSSVQLKAAIPGLMVATSGSATVRVVNPSPFGDRVSANRTYNITNGLPTATKLTPANKGVWTGDFNLTVTGTNFNNQSQVYWNGVPKSTTLTNATSLTASIPATDLQTAGSVQVWVVNPAPGGGKTANLTFTVNPVAPMVDSLAPTGAYVGGPQFTLTVNGQNFTSGAVVKWNGAIKTTTVVSSTRLNATILSTDLSAFKTVNITVTNPGTSGTSNTVQFPVTYGAPTITTTTPTFAKAGGAAFSLKLTGTNFTAASKVQWNGVNKTTALASGNLTASILATDIASPGTANVTVVNPGPGGGTSPITPFTVANPNPTITTLTPATAIAGGAAFNMTVAGTNFTSSSKVVWDGAEKQTWYTSSTSLKANILVGDIATAKTANVLVRNGVGIESTPRNFSVINGAPTATTLSPAIVPKGSPDTNVTITGTNFNTQSQVWWNGAVTGWPTNCINGTKLNLTIPASVFTQTAGTTAKVQVFNPLPGGGKTANLTFTIGQPVPTITSLNPVEGPLGAAGLSLRIIGTDFATGSKVYWNGVAKTPTPANITSTQITLWIPATDLASARDVLVKVQNPAPGSPFSNQVTFPVKNPLPGITSLSPTSAKAGGAAFTLIVNGNNFTKTSMVQWNGINKTTTFTSAAKLTASIPATEIRSPGTVNVTVNNPSPGGGSALNQTFTITNPQPSITSLSPISVKKSTALTLTVTGTNYTGSSRISWDGVNRTTTFVSVTQVRTSLTSGEVGGARTAVNVSVWNVGPAGNLWSGVNKTMNVTV